MAHSVGCPQCSQPPPNYYLRHLPFWHARTPHVDAAARCTLLRPAHYCVKYSCTSNTRSFALLPQYNTGLRTCDSLLLVPKSCLSILVFRQHLWNFKANCEPISSPLNVAPDTTP
eukprot:579270-Amphidinium_carterae.1